MSYTPLNYKELNTLAGSYSPSAVKAFKNQTYEIWQRSLFQRACSTIIFYGLPWDNPVRDFLYWCLFRFGFVAVFDSGEFGLSFQPCTLSGYDFYYQFTDAIISNPAITDSLDLKIGTECELVKLTPDYQGIFDVISYYAEKLATLDSAINMSLINNKFAYIVGARSKGAAQALKKMFDHVNKGEPAVIYDQKLLDNNDDTDSPFELLERKDLKQSYLTTSQLQDFQTILNNFDSEVGIPTIPYAKKERMVTSEAESRIVDSTSRSVIWYDCLRHSLEDVNNMFGTSMTVKLRYADSFADSADSSDDQGEGVINE